MKTRFGFEGGFSWIGDRAFKYTPHHGRKHLLDFHLEICPFVKKQRVLRCRTTSSQSTHSQLESSCILTDMCYKSHNCSEKSLLKFPLCESILVWEKRQIVKKQELHMEALLWGWKVEPVQELTTPPPTGFHALCLFHCSAPFWTAQQMGAVGF